MTWVILENSTVLDGTDTSFCMFKCVCVCVCVFVFYFTTQSIKTTTVPQHFPQDQMGML